MTFPKPRPQLTQPDDLSIKLVPLTQGQVAIVDADDYEFVVQWNWFAQYRHSTGTYYAARQGRRGEPLTLLHRQLLGEPDAQVDHINHDTLDDRMANLRPCTPAENSRNRRFNKNNTSGHAGVTRHKEKWQAQIKLYYKSIFLGLFATKEEAIAARKAGEAKYFGEFAPKKLPVSDNDTAYKSIHVA
jgi:hypothetical protein